ncbi:hypothetical protein PENTCL1PPCAC_26055, partial [Pristionchus entomophagus]
KELARWREKEARNERGEGNAKGEEDEPSSEPESAPEIRMPARANVKPSYVYTPRNTPRAQNPAEISLGDTPVTRPSLSSFNIRRPSILATRKRPMAAVPSRPPPTTAANSQEWQRSTYSSNHSSFDAYATLEPPPMKRVTIDSFDVMSPNENSYYTQYGDLTRL